MGRSARRLSRTRSGVVRARALAEGIARRSPAAPIPPGALLGGEKGIPGLGHGGGESIEAADVDLLPGDAAKPLVELFRILAGELGDAADAEKLEIAKHGRADRDEVPELASRARHKILLDTSLWLAYLSLV